MTNTTNTPAELNIKNTESMDCYLERLAWHAMGTGPLARPAREIIERHWRR